MRNAQRKPALESAQRGLRASPVGMKPIPSGKHWVVDSQGLVTTVENAMPPAFNPAMCGRDASA